MTNRRVLVPVLGGLLSLLIGVSSAAAHGTFVDVRPLPGVGVGGTVDEVAFLFPEEIVVVGATVSVTAPDGSEVPASGALVAPVPSVVRQPIARLADPGEYRVDYSIPSFDGTVFGGSFTFVYDPAAPPLEPLPFGRSSGVPLPAVAGAALGLVLVVRGLAVWRTSRRGGVVSPAGR
ncbi:MAG TPA: copper resistance protein CopC [Acidimicrobiia bacterium]|nr:copper resistance protein CopC [Acidimicrobiia bacterium]